MSRGAVSGSALRGWLGHGKERFRVRRRDPEEHDGGALRPAPSLFPVLQRVDADPQERGELGLWTPPAGDVRLIPPASAAPAPE